jgi:hypothetical protein
MRLFPTIPSLREEAWWESVQPEPSQAQFPAFSLALHCPRIDDPQRMTRQHDEFYSLFRPNPDMPVAIWVLGVSDRTHEKMC